MNKFCNVFLLNLILLSGNHRFEARVLGPISLYDVHFDAESKNQPQSNQNNFKFNSNNEKSEDDKSFRGYESPSLDTSSSEDIQKYDPQKLKCPLQKDRGVPKAPYKWTDSWYNKCMDEVANRWKNFEERRRKKRVSRRQMPGNELPLSFLDYTNSQMPFNEGKIRLENPQTATHQFSDVLWDDGKKSFYVEPFLASVAEPKRFERSVMKRRYEVPPKPQENIIETLQDDSILGYSRVRRFLDHERAKKRKRMSGTLEAKEAAMSRILDPNLNLDGILEPHVRKRRGEYSKKRSLRLNPLIWKN